MNDEELSLHPNQSIPVTRQQFDRLERSDQAHLVVVETVYHQQGKYQPTCTESRFGRPLESKDQPYVRRLMATEEWQKLDFGWIKRPGMLVIQNDEGQFKLMPTEAQKREMAEKYLWLAHSDKDQWALPRWIILPRESFRGHPATQDLYIQANKGPIEFTLTVYPS
jgi:hypothetical protein